jgi:hypothetical protein
MTHNTPSHPLALRAVLVLVLFMATVLSRGQEVHQLTDRENSGLKGPVRSVRTTVAKPNTDPRPAKPPNLVVVEHPGWEVFDPEGRQIASGFKCTFEADGSKVCNDSKGQQVSREQRTILPDGSREVEAKWFEDSKVDTREVTQFDEKGEFAGSRIYGDNDKLLTEDLRLPNGDYELKRYDDGVLASDERTRTSDDQNRIDRWFYDSKGHLMWSLAISTDGDLLSHWYNIGFKSEFSFSDSLSTCRPGLCVNYLFDGEGSGRLEKVVQHTQGKGNLEPDSEEHYNFDGVIDERAVIKYTRDGHGNWTSRSVSVWDPASNLTVEIKRDTRTIEYY